MYHTKIMAHTSTFLSEDILHEYEKVVYGKEDPLLWQLSAAEAGYSSMKLSIENYRTYTILTRMLSYQIAKKHGRIMLSPPYLQLLTAIWQHLEKEICTDLPEGPIERLRTVLELNNITNVLEIGHGGYWELQSTLYELIKERGGKVYSVELLPCNDVPEGLIFKNADMRALHKVFPDVCFDLIFASGVFSLGGGIVPYFKSIDNMVTEAEKHLRIVMRSLSRNPSALCAVNALKSVLCLRDIHSFASVELWDSTALNKDRAYLFRRLALLKTIRSNIDIDPRQYDDFFRNDVFYQDIKLNKAATLAILKRKNNNVSPKQGDPLKNSTEPHYRDNDTVNDPFSYLEALERDLGFKFVIRDLTLQISRLPERALAYFHRGNIYYKCHFYREAVRDYLKVMQLYEAKDQKTLAEISEDKYKHCKSKVAELELL